MLEILFAVLMFMIFGKILIFALKAAWGLMHILLTVVFLPLILIGMVMAGLMYLALPILIIVGLFALFGGARA